MCHRSAGSFARHVATTCSSSGGVDGSIVARGGGFWVAIADMTSTRLLPSKTFLPVTISCMITPSANRSLRASASAPSSCSGAMYCSVPATIPGALNSRLAGVLFCTSLASPKSRSFALLGVSITLEGFRSRCTMP